MPLAIRSDNGVPFASSNALFNLSKLSVWWLRLGIAIERIRPGHPQQNGRHERMHLTLKKETTRPPGSNGLQQQERFDAFIREFNTERPHEALDMKCPAEFCTTSARPYDGLPELTYPFHDRELLVTAWGRLCLHRKRINISIVLAGQKLGVKEVDDGIWLVSFMHYDLGYFDLEQKTLQPLDNPFGTRLSPMSKDKVLRRSVETTAISGRSITTHCRAAGVSATDRFAESFPLGLTSIVKDLLHSKMSRDFTECRCFSERPPLPRSMPQESPCSLSSALFSDFQSL